jgi:hypothetical protein
MTVIQYGKGPDSFIMLVPLGVMQNTLMVMDILEVLAPHIDVVQIAIMIVRMIQLVSVVLHGTSPEIIH